SISRTEVWVGGNSNIGVSFLGVIAIPRLGWCVLGTLRGCAPPRRRTSAGTTELSGTDCDVKFRYYYGGIWLRRSDRSARLEHARGFREHHGATGEGMMISSGFGESILTESVRGSDEHHAVARSHRF